MGIRVDYPAGFLLGIVYFFHVAVNVGCGRSNEEVNVSRTNVIVALVRDLMLV
jgi:hypothetical protein